MNAFSSVEVLHSLPKEGPIWAVPSIHFALPTKSLLTLTPSNSLSSYFLHVLYLFHLWPSSIKSRKVVGLLLVAIIVALSLLTAHYPFR